LELTGQAVLSTLVESHPRLILTDARVEEIRRAAGSDELLARCIEDVIARADEALEPPVAGRHRAGARAARVGAATAKRFFALAVAWRLTGRDDYAGKLVEVLLAACDMPDWRPDHFLDTAGLSLTAGLGYDWLYDLLTPAQRDKVADSLIGKGLKPGLDAYRHNHYWTERVFNWNNVCNSGLIVGSLAVAERAPELAGELLCNAIACLPKAIATYDPDGAWPEGVGYWRYATSYTVYGLAALDTALGRDFGLSHSDGLAETACFQAYLTGPTGKVFNFADCRGAEPGPTPFIYWLARRYGRPEYAAIETERLRNDPAEPQDVIWYWRPDEQKPFAPALDKFFGGMAEMAVMRSSWHDPQALFAVLKAGNNQAGHAQLDLGTFILDALGLRWATDLGADSYSLPGYFDKHHNGGRRWSYYRCASAGHNVAILDRANQDAWALARITRFFSQPERAFAVADLSYAYRDHAASVRRGLALIDGRRRVLVQDELDLARPCEVAWGMVTEADIEIGGRKAVLRQDGKTLRAEVLCPAGARFAAESAEQRPPQAENKGVRRLMIRLPGSSGKVTVAVLLAPEWPDGKQARTPRPKPLDQW